MRLPLNCPPQTPQPDRNVEVYEALNYYLFVVVRLPQSRELRSLTFMATSNSWPGAWNVANRAGTERIEGREISTETFSRMAS